MEKRTQFSIWYFLFALLAVMILHNMWVQSRTVEQVSYSEFQDLLKLGVIVRDMKAARG